MVQIAGTILIHPYLSYPEQRLLNDIVREIPPLCPSINKIILYGSKARGDFLEESDLDVMFLTDYALQRPLKFEIYDLIFELEVKFSITVSVVFLGSSDFHIINTGFVRQVREEGIVLWSRD